MNWCVSPTGRGSSPNAISKCCSQRETLAMQVGFIGLGHMGQHMARHVAEAGHSVAAFDLRVESVAELTASSSNAHRAGSVSIDLSSNSPTLVRRLYTEFGQKGIALLDAPVAGGVTGAEAGTLSIMVGGDREVFARVEPVLKAIGT